MTYEEIRARILSVAQFMAGGTGESDAFDIARERAWLDHNGAPTSLGTDLVQAMAEQSGTRTVFRTIS